MLEMPRNFLFFLNVLAKYFARQIYEIFQKKQQTFLFKSRKFARKKLRNLSFNLRNFLEKNK